METTTAYADTIENIACSVGNGWGAEEDQARELLREASYLLRQADYRESVDRAFAELARTEALTGCGPYDSEEERHYLSYGERTLDFGEYAWTAHGRGVNLTVCCFPEDRATIILMLISMGIVQGFSGDQSEFEEAFSDYGWISIRTRETRHPGV